MKRLAATMATDIRLQARNGFYYAAALVVVVWAVIVAQGRTLDLALLLPAVLFSNLLIGTYYFFGGLVLLEKGEGTLEAQIVTPLRVEEYLASKIATLTVLAVIESVLIAGLGMGFGFRWVALVPGVILASAAYCLIGFLAVVRFDSINEYLFPSFFFAITLSLPLLPYFDLLGGPLWNLHPLYGSLRVMEAGFRPVDPWTLGLAVPSAMVWSGILFIVAVQAFHRLVVARAGER